MTERRSATILAADVAGYTALMQVDEERTFARVSALMRNLEASPWLENPQLIEVKATTLGGRRSNEFAMNFNLTRVQPDQGGKQLKPSP